MYILQNAPYHLEYCEYGPGKSKILLPFAHHSPWVIQDAERCREWLERTLPDLLNQMQASSNSADDKSGERKNVKLAVVKEYPKERRNSKHKKLSSINNNEKEINLSQLFKVWHPMVY